ncbi:hypothetical protein R1flu_011711 [Riccia fluitans]|uniref:MULE transposase domain-containing protein n=1 Tax=Riccia fluitans TaxID=41844 RepID=A0ABD1Z9Q7_9MARC
MWRAKEMITDHIASSEITSFQCIPAFYEQIKSKDAGPYAKWETHPGTRMFWRMFISPSSLGKAFPHLRPHLGLDAYHNHKYPMQVMLATALDGNNQLNYLAYAIVDRENEENWRWFLENLKRVVTGIEQARVQFVSNHCKGIVNEGRDVFPG